jgi:hypothetical protein
MIAADEAASNGSSSDSTIVIEGDAGTNKSISISTNTNGDDDETGKEAVRTTTPEAAFFGATRDKGRDTAAASCNDGGDGDDLFDDDDDDDSRSNFFVGCDEEEGGDEDDDENNFSEEEHDDDDDDDDDMDDDDRWLSLQFMDDWFRPATWKRIEHAALAVACMVFALYLVLAAWSARAVAWNAFVVAMGLLAVAGGNNTWGVSPVLLYVVALQVAVTHPIGVAAMFALNLAGVGMLVREARLRHARRRRRRRKSGLPQGAAAAAGSGDGGGSSRRRNNNGNSNCNGAQYASVPSSKGAPKGGGRCDDHDGEDNDATEAFTDAEGDNDDDDVVDERVQEERDAARRVSCRSRDGARWR